MHWQTEAWKCAQPRDTPKLNIDPAQVKIPNKTKHQCGQVFYRREQFQVHLDEAHKVKDAEYVKRQCKLRRVGRNGQKGFWCGFCQTVVTLKNRGLEAWDERFTHIDEEHFKKGERVENWYPMDKDMPKGILDEEKQDSTSEREGEGDCSGSEVEGVDTALDGVPIESDGLTHVQSKIAGKASDQTEKVMVREWFCCRCTHGPMSRDVDLACVMQGCDHRRCVNCKREMRAVSK